MSDNKEQQPAAESVRSLTDESVKPLNCDRDAMRWSNAFNDILVSKGHQPFDPDWMMSWFANAMMCGEDTYRWKYEKEIEAKDRRIAELEADSKLKFDLIMEKGNKIAELEHKNSELAKLNIESLSESTYRGLIIKDLERRNAELEDMLRNRNPSCKEHNRIACVNCAADLVRAKHKIADLERQLKEATKYILYAPIFKDLANGEKALKEANEKIVVLEQQVRNNDKEIAELKWKLSDYHAREGLAKVKIEELEQQVRELRESQYDCPDCRFRNSK